MSDAANIPALVAQANTAAGQKAARLKATKNWPAYPSNACAYHLSALLQNAGIAIATEGSAGQLARLIEKRGWQRVPLGKQRPGDVGVTKDNIPTPPGADHIYLVIEVKADGDEMIIADNQGKPDPDVTHRRFASGKGKTATDYFLRAV
ncbi:MAG: hypothetical protein QOH47_2201 [Sphingomonadales bacterium]|nr:hypothetical protein [Sphingomonadales bacterium]